MAERKTLAEVAAGAPVNAQSARVLGRGVHWKPALELAPTYVRDEQGVPEIRKPVPGALDLTGHRFGRLVVKGLGAKKPVSEYKKTRKKSEGKMAGKVPAAWVVRCDCGAYEHRKSKALRSGAAVMCSHCAYLEAIKRKT